LWASFKRRICIVAGFWKKNFRHNFLHSLHCERLKGNFIKR
jgi:hypothetical protein